MIRNIMKFRFAMAKPMARPVMPMTQIQFRSFASPKKDDGGMNMADFAGTLAGAGVGNRQINTETLCALIGSRYYQHNEEITMKEDKIVKVFDENDLILGEMTLYEA